MQNKTIRIVQIGFALIILSWMGALPALAQDCKGWENKQKEYWEKITLEQIQDCLDNGANIKARGKHGSTLLHWAASYNKNPKVITLLMNAGLNVNSRNSGGQTPLHWAASGNKNPEVIKVLLENRADLHAQSKQGFTPLHRAAFLNKNPDIINMLIQAGADINARDMFRSTPIHWVTDIELFKVFIDAGADVNTKDQSQLTPLHKVAKYDKNPESIMMLLKAGADGKAKDGKGKTAFDYAKENKALKDTEAYWALNDAQY